MEMVRINIFYYGKQTGYQQISDSRYSKTTDNRCVETAFTKDQYRNKLFPMGGMISVYS